MPESWICVSKRGTSLEIMNYDCNLERRSLKLRRTCAARAFYVFCILPIAEMIKVACYLC